MKRQVAILLCTAFAWLSAVAQTGRVTTPLQSSDFPAPLMKKVTEKYTAFERKLFRRSGKTLDRMQRREHRLYRKLSRRDSAAANRLFANSEEMYRKYAKQMSCPDDVPVLLNTYVPALDSLRTGMRFLQQAPLLSQHTAILNAGVENIGKLQSKIAMSGSIQKFLLERQKALVQQLGNYGMGKQVASLTKEIYYYRRQLEEYRSLLNDPDRLSRKVLTLLADQPGFQEFMRSNSMLASLFPAQTDPSRALQGLQTRASVAQQLQTVLRGAPVSVNPQQYLQQQISAAQEQLQTLKDKVNRLGNAGGELAMPKGFIPNGQKTKTFMERIEYGLNIQSQRPNGLLPVITDLTLTAGYKLNDKSIIGVGAGIKLGWGKDIRHIRISGQGASMRSFIDIKLEKNTWVTGAYEYHYLHEFTKIEALHTLSAWQNSGLIGLTQKYRAGKRSGNFQLLWDFLSYSQVPRTPALKFRIGYTF